MTVFESNDVEATGFEGITRVEVGMIVSCFDSIMSDERVKECTKGELTVELARESFEVSLVLILEFT